MKKKARKPARVRVLAWLVLATLGLPSARAVEWGDPQHVLLTGRAALADGLYEMAAEKFARFVQLVREPERRAEAVVLLAETRCRQGRYEAAESLLIERQAWIEGTPYRPAADYWQAVAAFNQGRYSAALSVLGDVRQAFAGNAWLTAALRLQAQCYLEAGREEDALEVLAAFAEQHPDAPEAPGNLLDWAGLLIRRGAREEAAEKLRTLTERYPNAPAALRARLWLGELALEEGDADRAIAQLGELLGQEEAPESLRAEGWFMLATVYEAQTNLHEAVRALDRSAELERDPEATARINMMRGTYLLELGNVEEGLDMFKESVVAMTDKTEAARAQLEVAETLRTQGLYEQAAEEFQHYLEAFSEQPGRADALEGKGWCLWQLERYAEAAIAFEKAFDLQEDAGRKARCLLKSADAYFANGQYTAAQERYRQFVRRFPRSDLIAQARFQLAEALARADQPDAAQSELEALAEEYAGTPEAEKALIRIALLSESRGEWEKAIEDYERVMRLHPDGEFFVKALHGRGLIRYRLGRFEEALADFKRVTEEFSDSGFGEQAAYMRGWCLYLMGQNEEAVEICTAFVGQYPDSVWSAHVLFWLGEYHFNQGDYAAAEKWFLDVGESNPEHELADEALYWAGRAAASQKEYLRAIDHYNALSTRYANSGLLAQTRFAQGDALSELGRFSNAILAFEEVVRKFPDSYLVDRAWGRMGDCQFTLGSDDPARYDKALACYRTILESGRASVELRMQAEYKMGRCYEKMNELEKAFERYMNVVYRYFVEWEKGVPVGGVWFTRAAFSAGAMKEAAEDWRQAVNIYRRVVEAGVPAAPDAQKRIQKIQLEHWLPFLRDYAGDGG